MQNLAAFVDGSGKGSLVDIKSAQTEVGSVLCSGAAERERSALLSAETLGNRYSQTTIAGPHTKRGRQWWLKAHIPVHAITSRRAAYAVAVVNIIHAFFVSQHYSPRLLGHLDVVRVYLCPGFRV